MKIVVPVSRADSEKLENWVSCVKKFGGMELHSIHFIPTRSVMAKTYEAAGKLGEVCKDVRVSPLDMDNENGWPMAPNWQWYSAVRIMEELSVPWFWMELDCLPVRAGWASEIGSSYSSAGLPFLGCLVPTPHKDPTTGKEVESPDGPEDKMMCGCGIYPSNLISRFNMAKQPGLLEDFAKGGQSAPDPWDLHLRHAMKGIGMGHTATIGDYWNTCNYRVEDGKLICDAKETDGNDKQVNVRRAGAVNPQAVVLHGCKDDSLFKLVMGGLDTRTLTPIVPVLPEKQQSTTVPNQEVEALKAQLARMEAMFTQVMAEKTAPPAKPKAQPVLQQAPTPPAGSQEETIVQCLKGSPVALRLAQVTGLTGIPQERIRFLALQPDCPYSIAKGGLGWIKLKSLTAV